MSRNTAMAEAAQMAEQNMDVFRRALLQRVDKRRAATQTAQQDAQTAQTEPAAIEQGGPRARR